MNLLLALVIGLVAGTFSGFLGIGGGIVMVPALVYFFKMNQHLAQGTSLAIMIPPIGLLAAWKYYAVGNVNVAIAILVCLGFFFGGYVGAQFAHVVPDQLLRRIFGFAFFLISVKMMLGR